MNFLNRSEDVISIISTQIDISLKFAQFYEKVSTSNSLSELN